MVSDTYKHSECDVVAWVLATYSRAAGQRDVRDKESGIRQIVKPGISLHPQANRIPEEMKRNQNIVKQGQGQKLLA